MNNFKKDDFEEEKNEPAAFNDALTTLGRIGSPLEELKILDYFYPSDTAQKQRSMIDLVKRFYTLCSPLMQKKEVENYSFILKIKPVMKFVVKGGVQSRRIVFDDKLDYTLRKTLIELQWIIRKYLMPQRRDDDGL